MAITKNFAQMSSKRLREIIPTLTSEEEVLYVENLLAERGKYLKPTKSIQDYKNEFAVLYNEMIAEMGVDKASVSVSWTTEKKNGEWVKKPSVLITF